MNNFPFVALNCRKFKFTARSWNWKYLLHFKLHTKTSSNYRGEPTKYFQTQQFLSFFVAPTRQEMSLSCWFKLIQNGLNKFRFICACPWNISILANATTNYQRRFVSPASESSSLVAKLKSLKATRAICCWLVTKPGNWRKCTHLWQATSNTQFGFTSTQLNRQSSPLAKTVSQLIVTRRFRRDGDDAVRTKLKSTMERLIRDIAV